MELSKTANETVEAPADALIIPSEVLAPFADTEDIRLFQRFHEAVEGLEYDQIINLMEIAEETPQFITEVVDSSLDPDRILSIIAMWREIVDPIREAWIITQKYDSQTTEKIREKVKEIQDTRKQLDLTDPFSSTDQHQAHARALDKRKIRRAKSAVYSTRLAEYNAHPDMYIPEITPKDESDSDELPATGSGNV